MSLFTFISRIFHILLIKPQNVRDGPLFFIRGLPILGLADNFFYRIMRFKQFFSLYFVMKTIFYDRFKNCYRLFYRSYLK